MGLAIHALLTVLLAPAPQQFLKDGGVQLPNLGSDTEAAKFGDWDLDGDLDLVYANGGDLGNQQSRLLVNQGLAQGGTIGFYLDATASLLLPNLAMSSRDVEPFDIDDDGDLDLLFANHSTNTAQSSAWFVNLGGAQGGLAGSFQMDMGRFVGIGAAGSSVASGLLLTTGPFAGGFQDWSCQADFADVDLDGDLDLYHSSYGQGFSAGVMARLFLNNANTAIGYFSEYNPSGFVSGNPNLAAGSLAGFVEGQQSTNTLDTTGQFHDITNSSLDLDFADLDGDFDIDVFAQSRDTRSRFYSNRYQENGGTLGLEALGTRLYRDMTGAWGVNVSNADSNYDADLHDLDNDGDIDGYFLNYSGNTSDGWALNDGTGTFGVMLAVPGSGNDDNEIDWHDYDHDGDVDPVISAFSGNDKFYKNQWAETGTVSLTLVSGLANATGNRSLAADAGDIDNDGDGDLVFAEDANLNEVLLVNQLNLPDPIAPRIPDLSQVQSASPSSTPRVVVARAYDNANLETFKTALAVLAVSVNGNQTFVPARWAGGNAWTAKIPGYWTGSIVYWMVLADRVGNAGISGFKSYNAPMAGFAIYGFETPGCHGTQIIDANSAPTIANPDFKLTCRGGPPNTTQLCLITNSQGTGNDPFGLGFALWVGIFGASEVYAVDALVDPTGVGTAVVPIPNNPLLVGSAYYAQFLHADFACPQLLSASAGAQLLILP